MDEIKAKEEAEATLKKRAEKFGLDPSAKAKEEAMAKLKSLRLGHHQVFRPLKRARRKTLLLLSMHC